MPTASSSTASQVRIASRPSRRLPATIWADPGTSRVMNIREMARRKRTRAARSGTPGVPEGGAGRDADGTEGMRRTSLRGRGADPRSVSPVTRATERQRPHTACPTPAARRRDPGPPPGSFGTMADRPRGKGGPQEGTPEYQWLYGSQGSGPADDATRAVQRPAAGRPASSSQAPADHTRVMPASPAPAPGRRSAGAPPPAGPGGPSGPGPAWPRSASAPAPDRRLPGGPLGAAALAGLPGGRARSGPGRR